MSREEEVTELLKPVVESMGYEWVGVQYHHNSVNAILRIYIDKPEGGIDMDGIVAVTEQINPILDAEDPISTAYTLEVSSPGIDRPLFSIKDFARFAGEQVKIHLRTPINKRRRLTGTIQSADIKTHKILLIQDAKQDEIIEIDYADVEKARLNPDF